VVRGGGSNCCVCVWSGGREAKEMYSSKLIVVIVRRSAERVVKGCEKLRISIV